MLALPNSTRPFVRAIIILTMQMAQSCLRWAIPALFLTLVACGKDPLHGAGFGAVAVSRSAPQRVYAAANTASASVGIYRSDDAGQTWRKTEGDWWDKPSSANTVSKIAVSPDNPDIVLILNQYAMVSRSEDGGRSWSQPQFIMGYSGSIHRFIFHPQDPERVYALAELSLWISTDGGRTWQDQRKSSAPECQPGYCKDLAFDTVNPDRMYAACEKGVAVSDDAGACWRVNDAGGVRPGRLITSPLEPGKLWGAALDGVWLSVDSAQTFAHLTDWSTVFTWSDVPPDPYAKSPRGLIPTNGVYAPGASEPMLLFGTWKLGVIGVGTQNGAVVDLGASLIRRADAINDLAVTNNGNVLLAGGETCRGRGGLFSSTDQRGVWNDVLLGSPYEPITEPFGEPVPHEIQVIFYRDVTPAQQQQIFLDHHVKPMGSFGGPLLWFLYADDDRSVSDLLREFGALDEVNCVLNDFYLSLS